MKYAINIFTVSVVAIMSVVTARAEVVSTSMLDNRLGNLSYTDLKNKPAIPTVDTALNTTSTNTIQNKAVATALNAKADTSTVTALDTRVTTAEGTLSNKQDTSNMVTNTEYGDATAAGQVTKYPNMPVAYQIAQDVASTMAGGKVDKVNTNQKNKVMITDDKGTVTFVSALGTEKIADNAITSDKLDPNLNSSINKAENSVSKDEFNAFESANAQAISDAANAAKDEAINSISTALAGKVNINQGANNKNKIMATNGTGEVNPVAIEGEMGVEVSGPSSDGKIVVKGKVAGSDPTDPLGVIMSGGDVTVNGDGTVTVNKAAVATTAEKATKDANGNVIFSTYEKVSNKVNTEAGIASMEDLGSKEKYPSMWAMNEIMRQATNGLTTQSDIDTAIGKLDVSASTAAGNVVTNVSQTDGKISVSRGNVKIPIGSADGTTYADIWIQ